MPPYDAPLISRLLRAMPDHVVASIKPADFQRHPVAVVITRAATIRELIANERSRRSR